MPVEELAVPDHVPGMVQPVEREVDAGRRVQRGHVHLAPIDPRPGRDPFGREAAEPDIGVVDAAATPQVIEDGPGDRCRHDPLPADRRTAGRGLERRLQAEEPLDRPRRPVQ